MLDALLQQWVFDLAYHCLGLVGATGWMLVMLSHGLVGANMETSLIEVYY